MEPHDAECLMAGFIDRDKGHRSRIIELGQQGDELRRKFLDGIGEAKPQVSLADIRQKIADQSIVIRLERPDKNPPAIPENDMSLSLRPVWADAGYQFRYLGYPGASPVTPASSGN